MSFEPEVIIIRKKSPMFKWSACRDGVLMMLITFGITCILQVMMIVVGATNPTVICKSPCWGLECTFPRNTPITLSTPSIGISAPVWLIVGGLLGIFFIILVPFGLKCCRTVPGTQIPMRVKCDVQFVLTLVLYLASFAWLIVGIFVYKQTNESCAEHNKLWSVESPAMSWLFGTMIGGYVFLVGPMALAYIAASCKSICLCHKPMVSQV
jgi:hypothetical protein